MRKRAPSGASRRLIEHSAWKPVDRRLYSEKKAWAASFPLRRKVVMSVAIEIRGRVAHVWR